MKAIWKFPVAVPIQGHYVAIPGLPRFLHVAPKGTPGEAQVWAEVDPEDAPRHYVFSAIATGRIYAPDQFGTYLGTVFDGPFVWHVFVKPLH